MDIVKLYDQYRHNAELFNSAQIALFTYYEKVVLTDYVTGYDKTVAINQLNSLYSKII